jgi:hypothetical protein
VSRRTIHIAAATLLAALLILAAVPASAVPASAATPRRVVVVLAPYVTLSDMAVMPSLKALAEKSMLVDVNVRAGDSAGAATPDRGALVLSTGSPVTYADGALAAFSAFESVSGVPARDLYLQYFGIAPGDASILYAGQPRQVLVNSVAGDSAVVGALGTAAHTAGVRTAAIGNGDFGMWAVPGSTSRPAGIAVADESGRADAGDVSTKMLATDPSAPFGARANVEAIVEEYRLVTAGGGAGLVVIDPGDLARANAITSVVTSAAAARTRAAALASTDRVVGGVVSASGPNDVVIVLTQAVLAQPGVAPGFGSAVIFDGSGAGIGASPSTHRDGLVTLMDVSTTVVGFLGGTPPAAMVGSRIHPAVTASGAPLAERLDILQRMDRTAAAVESIRFDVVNWFIIIAVIVLLAAALVVYRGRDGLPSWAPGAAGIALLVPMAVLLGALVQYLLVRWPTSGSEVILMLVVGSVLALAMALAARRFGPSTVPLIALAGVTSIVILIDQWSGAPLSFAGLFGYSTLLGARYYGLGNEMAGLLFGSATVALALTLDTWPKARWHKPLTAWGWPVLGIVLIATAAAPMLGANVGPVAWMTVGLLVGWMMLRGKKVLTWRNVATVLVLIVVIVVGLSALDLLGGAATQTHLGRAISGAESGGIGTLWTIIVRKAETNMRILGRTNWTWMLVAVLALLGYMRWRPRGEFAAMLKRYPAFSISVAAALFAGVVGYFTEDSGIIIPALMFIPVGVSALYLMLPVSRGAGGESE